MGTEFNHKLEKEDETQVGRYNLQSIVEMQESIFGAIHDTFG